MADRLPWFALDAQDWLNGTIDLSEEAQGVYMRLLAVMWLRKSRLTNDYCEIAKLTGVNPKRMAKCLAELIAKGKITDDGETIGNPRMDRDIRAIAARSKSAERRESDKAQSRINRRSIDDQSTINPGSIVDQSTIFDAKSEKNQQLKKQRENSPIEIEKEREKKKENSQPAAPRVEAAREPDRHAEQAAAGELAGLNGSTTEIINGLARWLEPGRPDVATATRVISRDLAIYGPQAVKDGYADLATAIDANEPVANPLKAYHGFVKNAAERLAGRKETAKKRGKSYGEGAPVKTFADREEGLRQTYDMYCQRKLQGKPWPDHPDLPEPGKPGSEKFADILKLHMLPVYSAKNGSADWNSVIGDALPNEVV